jgi:hypothetical protein
VLTSTGLRLASLVLHALAELDVSLERLLAVDGGVEVRVLLALAFDRDPVPGGDEHHVEHRADVGH